MVPLFRKIGLRIWRLVAPFMFALFFLSGLFSVAKADVAAWLVLDVQRGVVLDSQNAGRLWPPASVTKMMSAYVVFQAVREGRIRADAPVIMSEAADAVPYGMKFKAGTSMTLDDAIKMMIVKSANDVSHAIAEAVSGTEEAFVAEMNAVSARLGLSKSRWENPHGLSEAGMVTTARDIAVLTHRLWMDFPEFRSYFAIGAIQYGDKIYRSRNRLKGRYPGVNGMKTGYVCDSGNNVVTTATRQGRTIGVITLGASGFLERAVVTKTLVDHGFRKRWGGTPLSRFGGEDGADLPLINRYCDVWNKPEPADLLTRYAPKIPKKQPLLSLIEPSRGTEAYQSKEATKVMMGQDPEADEITPAVVLDAVVGLDRGVVPVVVRTGIERVDSASPGTKARSPAAALRAIPRPRPQLAALREDGLRGLSIAPSIAPSIALGSSDLSSTSDLDGQSATAKDRALTPPAGSAGRVGGVSLSQNGPISLTVTSLLTPAISPPAQAIDGVVVAKPGFPVPRPRPPRP